jgi:hypothetical protein
MSGSPGKSPKKEKLVTRFVGSLFLESFGVTLYVLKDGCRKMHRAEVSHRRTIRVAESKVYYRHSI